MARYLEIKFVEQNISARARLLDDEMPRTCGELVKHLPVESIAIHARYSGSEVAMLLSSDIRIGREKATCVVETGDVGYVWLNQADHYGLYNDVSEICWFYDKDSKPAMAEGPVRVNVFAKIEGDATEFFKASANTRITGAKNIRINLIEE